MPAVRVGTVIDAPLAQVWDEIADLGSHGTWMGDVESLTFEGPSRTGVGTRLRVGTKVGPFRTMDVLEVVEWVEKRAVGVRHSGLVTGTGRFELAPLAGGIRLTWTERLSFPLWLGGPVTALLVRPVLAAVWRRNLATLKRRLEASTAP